jgi:hypothetical protein
MACPRRLPAARVQFLLETRWLTVHRFGDLALRVNETRYAQPNGTLCLHRQD